MAMVRSRRSRGSWKKVLGSVLLSVSLAVPAIAYALDAYGRSRVDPGGSWDAIVVLGCAVYPGNVPSPALERRTRRGVSLWKAGRAPLLVLTGAVGASDQLSEAEVEAILARRLGVPDSAIVLEARSHTTADQSRLVPTVIAARRVLIVTDAYHVARSEWLFARRFAEVRGVSVISEPYPRAKGALREVFAWAGSAIEAWTGV